MATLVIHTTGLSADAREIDMTDDELTALAERFIDATDTGKPGIWWQTVANMSFEWVPVTTRLEWYFDSPKNIVPELVPPPDPVRLRPVDND